MIRAVGERAPDSLVNRGFVAYLRIQQVLGKSYHSYYWQGREFRYAYADKQSFLQHWGCIENGQIALEGVPLSQLGVSRNIDGIIDIGAHQGLYTVALGVINDDIPLIAAEPISENASWVRKNAELNQFDVQVEETIVSDTDGKVSFYKDAKLGSERHTTTPSQDIAAYKETTVSSTTASTLAKKIGSSSPFLKIDAEGEEQNILRELYQSNIQEYSGLVELHSDKLPNGSESVLDMLDDFGVYHEFVTESSPDYVVSRPIYYFER